MVESKVPSWVLTSSFGEDFTGRKTVVETIWKSLGYGAVSVILKWTTGLAPTHILWIGFKKKKKVIFRSTHQLWAEPFCHMPTLLTFLLKIAIVFFLFLEQYNQKHQPIKWSCIFSLSYNHSDSQSSTQELSCTVAVANLVKNWQA